MAAIKNRPECNSGRSVKTKQPKQEEEQQQQQQKA